MSGRPATAGGCRRCNGSGMIREAGYRSSRCACTDRPTDGALRIVVAGREITLDKSVRETTLAESVVAIVRANSGKVDYRLLSVLTGQPRTALRTVVADVRRRGDIR